MTEKAKKISTMLLFNLALVYDDVEEMSGKPVPLSVGDKTKERSSERLLANWYDKLDINLKLYGDPWPTGSENLNDLWVRCKRYAMAVAAKLDKITPKSRQEWFEAVREALHSVPLNVFITIDEQEPTVLVAVPGFAEGLADISAVLVAPRNSRWFRDLEAELRGRIAEAKPAFAENLIESVIEQWREGNHVSIKF